MALKIAVKPGATYTSIFAEGHGLVLREPTLVAFDDKNRRKVRAVGYEALSMQGKAPNVSVVSPMTDGIVSEPDVFTLMLREFLNKIFVDYIFKPRMDAFVAIPLGLTLAEREMYEDALIDAGVVSATLIPGVILAAIGADLPVGTQKGIMSVNLGGGRTDMALLSYGGILNGCGVAIGGSAFDRAVVDYIVGRYGIRIDAEAAKKLREDVGTLVENDAAYCNVSGMDISSDAPQLVPVHASDIREVITPYLVRICDLTKTIIKTCPSNIAKDIMTDGISLTGGVSNMPGIGEFFMKQLGLPVTRYSRPEYLQITGLSKLLGSEVLMDQLVRGGAV